MCNMSKRSTKSDGLFEVLRERILRGDYLGAEFPSERKLAGEFGLTQPTVRKVIKRAIEEGYLSRNTEGRLSLSQKIEAPIFQACLLLPSPLPAFVEEWVESLRSVVAARHGILRVYHYIDTYDPVLTRALNLSFDLFFIYPVGGFNRLVKDLIKAKQERVITLFVDIENLKLRRFNQMPLEAVSLLCEHLFLLGHRRIDYVSLGDTSIATQRIEVWREWTRKNRIEGHLHTSELSSKLPLLERAVFAGRSIFGRPDRACSAFICNSIVEGEGALRALHELKLAPGRDVSVAAVGSSERARYLIPSLTCLDAPSQKVVLAQLLDAAFRRGPIVPFCPDVSVIEVFAADSTGMAASRSGVSPAKST